MSSDKKTVLVADDSPVVRTLLKHIIESSGEFVVAGQASNGLEAIALTQQLKPHVVTMDVQMPKLDGPGAIRQIMKECPTPVLLCSVLATEGAPVVLESLNAGAFDFVTKPRSVMSDTAEFTAVVLEKLRAALTANRESLAAEVLTQEEEAPPAQQAQAEPASGTARLAGGEADVLALGTNTGGPKALLAILPGLPATLRASVIVALQGMPAPILKLICDQLSKVCPLPVQMGSADLTLLPGRITLLPADHHAMIVRGAEPAPRLRLLEKHVSAELTPSLNGLFSSVAVACPHRSVAVVLTGTGKDGALGLKKVRAAGGVTIVEDKATAVVFDKPAAAIAMGVADYVLPCSKISQGILRLLAPRDTGDDPARTKGAERTT